MSNADNYLKELLDMEQKQGIALLRSVVVQFSTTLDRLPRIKQEIDVMLEPGQELNYESLAASLEQHLDKAANLLARFDLLTDKIRSDSEFEGFLSDLQNTMTLSTIDTWHDAFIQKNKEAERRRAEAIEQKRRENEEAERRRAEAVEKKHREEKEAERRSAEAIEQKKIEKYANITLIIIGVIVGLGCLLLFIKYPEEMGALLLFVIISAVYSKFTSKD